VDALQELIVALKSDFFSAELVDLRDTYSMIVDMQYMDLFPFNRNTKDITEQFYESLRTANVIQSVIFQRFLEMQVEEQNC